MARKVRNYPSVEVVRNMIEEYFADCREMVIDRMLYEFGYTSIESLRYAEFHMRFGADCGWVWVKTYSQEQEREWRLDNGKYDAFVRGIRLPYDSQSTTLKKFQIDLALKHLGLNNEYYTYVRLD